MSISGFTEELLKRLDAAFERDANNALGAVRMFDTNRATAMTGHADGIHDASLIVREVYKLFVTPDNEENENDKPLY